MLETVNRPTSILEHVFKYFIPKQDLTLPHRTRRQVPRHEDAILNRARLDVRHSLGARSQIRLYFDCLTRHRGQSVYRRILGQTVYLDCPTPEQAELAIEAILSFAASLDGKWLAPAEPAPGTQATDSAMLREHSVNPVNESGESADNLQAIGKRLASEQAQASGDAAQVQEQQEFSGS